MYEHKTFLTQERYRELTAELHELKTEGRRRIADRLRHAKDMGDLSENFDYQEAREEQSRLEQRILQLEELLKHFSIIRKGGRGETVRVGSKVTVEKGKTVTTYTIVGSNEAQPVAGLISNESPLGKSMLGKKVGATVTVRTPKGEVNLHIIAIE